MLLQYLNDPLLSTCLVFIVRGPVNKQKKLVKAIEKKGVLLELNTPKGQELISWVKEEAGALGLALEPQACEYLIMNAGYSMRVLRSELEKLALYAGSNNKVTLETAQELVAKSSEANIFTLVDSIGRKEGETALTELHHLITSGEPPVRILFMIARQFRLLLQAKDMKRKGCTERQITAALSLPAFVTVKILKQANNFNFSELEDCLQQMLECDLAMKTGSPPRQTLEDLVLKLVWHNRLGGMKNA